MHKLLIVSFAVFFAGLFSPVTLAQTPASSTFPSNGTLDKHLVKTVLEHATVHVDASTVLNDATVVLFRGEILEVKSGESDSSNPLVSGAFVRLDLTGYHLYPSFVDLHSSYGLPEVKPAEWSRTPQYETNIKGAYGWNQSVRPEIDAYQKYIPDSKKAKALREACRCWVYCC